nr:DUF1993 domain-containing protein [Legionella tunisiensis]
MNPAISMYSASIPVFKQLLNSLTTILDKAQTHLVSSGMAADALLQASLFPDMFDFTRQIQIATDFAKGVAARLAGLEVPAYEDNEDSFEALQARIEKPFNLSRLLSPNKSMAVKKKKLPFALEPRKKEPLIARPISYTMACHSFSFT